MEVTSLREPKMADRVATVLQMFIRRHPGRHHAAARVGVDGTVGVSLADPAEAFEVPSPNR